MVTVADEAFRALSDLCSFQSAAVSVALQAKQISIVSTAWASFWRASWASGPGLVRK
jgi:hypothetical protein